MNGPPLRCPLCLHYHRCKRKEKDKCLCVEFWPCHCQRKMELVNNGIVWHDGEKKELRRFKCRSCAYEIVLYFPMN